MARFLDNLWDFTAITTLFIVAGLAYCVICPPDHRHVERPVSFAKIQLRAAQ